jgi:hypothetical protein
MEYHLKNRPNKSILSIDEIDRIRILAITKIKEKLLPDDKIIKVILIGSSVKESFGKYEEPGFRGSLYSDFDFIVFIEDDYQIPTWLDRELDGKPFTDDNINLAYRTRKFIDDKYDAEVFFLRRSSFENLTIQEEGELAGIPMTNTSKHKYLLIYEK